MRTIDPASCTLLIVDFQAKLRPTIHEADASIANARRLVQGAEILGVPTLYTEQVPDKLGPTVSELAPPAGRLTTKTAFAASGAPGFVAKLPRAGAVVIAGWEAHVCVLQSALGLLEAGRHVYVVEDAIASRTPDNKAAAVRRLDRHDVEIVTTEMVLFEWMGAATHPRFREVIALIK